MTDGQTEVAPEPVEPPPAAQAPRQSAGQLLKQAREAQGLHIAALAVSLKVPVRKLEALESDQYDQLPDAVFVRALAASVCRSLKIDPAAVLERLPGSAAPRLGHDREGLNAPFRSPRDGPPPSALDQISRPAVLVVLALLLAALVLVFLPKAADNPSVVSESVKPAAPAMEPLPARAAAPDPAHPGETVNRPADTPATMPAAVSTTTSAAPAIPPVASASAAADPAMKPTLVVSVAKSTPTVPSPTMVVTPMAGAAPMASGPADLMVFSATGPSWIEVTDAKGQVPLRRTLEKGEQVAITGPPPLAVVIGNVDHTRMMLRGKRYDLGVHARDNVARFEVK